MVHVEHVDVLGRKLEPADGIVESTGGFWMLLGDFELLPPEANYPKPVPWPNRKTRGHRGAR